MKKAARAFARRRQTLGVGLLASTAIVSAVALSTSAPAQEEGGADYLVYVANEYYADISVIDPDLGEVIATIPISGRPGDVRPRGMAVSPDGHTIYVSISDFNPEFETPEDKIVGIEDRKSVV